MNAPRVTEISVEDTRTHFDAGTADFVDIRDEHSYGLGHIPGAKNLSDQNVAEFLAGADRVRKLVVYCYHGHSSMGAAAWFTEQGFEDVASMTGGFTSWRFNNPIE